jgi:pSer/pThr/pTyr-binding forkhead associated (FHA) protein/tetratricopeptide (TPR) repeat protein
MSAAPLILSIYREGALLREVPVSDSEFEIGRGEECALRLDDRAISRRHAVLRLVDGSPEIQKMSKFGSLVVNGQGCDRALIKSGDSIALGPFVLRIDAPKAIAPPPPMDGVVPEALPVAESQVVEALPELPSFEAQLSDTSQEKGEEVGALPESPDVSLDLGPSASDLPQPSSSEVEMDLAGDGVTRVTTISKLMVRLRFSPGSANVTDYEFKSKEVLIGRGKSCDIVLADKKASRKSAIIQRVGSTFLLKDAGSSNGVFVNGQKIESHELSGGDVIQIGDTEFSFVAESEEYRANAESFMSVPEPEESLPVLDAPPAPEQQAPLLPVPQVSEFLPHIQHQQPVMGGFGTGAIPFGVAGAPAPEDRSLLGKVRKLPKRTQVILGIFLVLALYELTEEEELPPPPKRKPTAVQSAKPAEGKKLFENLSPEDQQYVRQQYQLGQDLYQRAEYEKSVYELDKIFAKVDDYKDARALKRYADGILKRQQAQLEEKQKQEREEALRLKVQKLIEDVRVLMLAKKYEDAQAMFPELLSIDPENAEVAKWKTEIEQHEGDLRRKAENELAITQINKSAWEAYQSAMLLRKRGKLFSALSAFGKVKEIEAPDPRPARQAQARINEIRAEIRSKVEPLLAEAKAQENAGELAQAYKTFERVLGVQPGNADAVAGMNSIRGTLTEKARLIFIEAVVAESYSDFETARKKFNEVLEVAPRGSKYFDSATRKLARFKPLEQKTE